MLINSKSSNKETKLTETASLNMKSFIHHIVSPSHKTKTEKNQPAPAVDVSSTHNVDDSLRTSNGSHRTNEEKDKSLFEEMGPQEKIRMLVMFAGKGTPMASAYLEAIKTTAVPCSDLDDTDHNDCRRRTRNPRTPKAA